MYIKHISLFGIFHLKHINMNIEMYFVWATSSKSAGSYNRELDYKFCHKSEESVSACLLNNSEINHRQNLPHLATFHRESRCLKNVCWTINMTQQANKQCRFRKDSKIMKFWIHHCFCYIDKTSQCGLEEFLVGTYLQNGRCNFLLL